MNENTDTRTLHTSMDALTFRSNQNACDTLHSLVHHRVMQDALAICDALANRRLTDTVESMAIQGAFSAGVRAAIRTLHELCIPVDPIQSMSPEMTPEMLRHEYFLNATKPTR